MATNKYAQAGYYASKGGDLGNYYQMAQRERLMKGEEEKQRKAANAKEASDLWQRDDKGLLPYYQTRVAELFDPVIQKYMKDAAADPDGALSELRRGIYTAKEQAKEWEAKNAMAKKILETPEPGKYANASVIKWSNIFMDPKAPREAVATLNDPARGVFAKDDGTFMVDLVQAHDNETEANTRYDNDENYNPIGNPVNTRQKYGQIMSEQKLQLKPEAIGQVKQTILSDPKRYKSFTYGETYQSTMRKHNKTYPPGYYSNPAVKQAFDEEIISDWATDLSKNYPERTRFKTFMEPKGTTVNVNTGDEQNALYTFSGPTDGSYTAQPVSGQEVDVKGDLVYEKDGKTPVMTRATPMNVKIRTADTVTFTDQKASIATGKTFWNSVSGKMESLPGNLDVQTQAFSVIPSVKKKQSLSKYIGSGGADAKTYYDFDPGRPLGPDDIELVLGVAYGEANGVKPTVKKQGAGAVADAKALTETLGLAKQQYGKLRADLNSSDPAVREKALKVLRENVTSEIFAPIQGKSLTGTGGSEFSGWIPYTSDIAGPLEAKVRGHKNRELYTALQARKTTGVIAGLEMIGVSGAAPVPITTVNGTPAFDKTAAVEGNVYVHPNTNKVFVFENGNFVPW